VISTEALFIAFRATLVYFSASLRLRFCYSAPQPIKSAHGDNAMADKKIEELDSNFAQAKIEGDVHWHDIREWGVEGQGWNDTEAAFDRLPKRAKGVVRDSVWKLSQCSSGLCVRFETSAPAINARWRLRNLELCMAHMPATGVSGLDLYILTYTSFRRDKISLRRYAGRDNPAGRNRR